MSSKPSNDPIYKQKRVLKGEIKYEVLAIITRLGKEGKIIFNGDLEQKDTNNNGDMNGLSYLYSLSKAIPDIKLKKLQHQHRSDLVGKILDWEYKDKS